jgi:hypothetical protein
MLAPSAGVHVTLPDYYSPEGLGMIVPKTRDGRVVFMLPWQGETIAGTTDAPAAATATPQPSEADIAFILDAISDYLTVKARLLRGACGRLGGPARAGLSSFLCIVHLLFGCVSRCEAHSHPSRLTLAQPNPAPRTRRSAART